MTTFLGLKAPTNLFAFQLCHHALGSKERGRRQAGLWLAGAPGGTAPGWPQGEDQVSGAVAGVAGTRADICLADVSCAPCI